MPNLTQEQRMAVESKGKLIVSASAGSGKTFVMITKLIEIIESGVDLDNILAVTFTKKAAAQMKEKLRKRLIEAVNNSSLQNRAFLKEQLTKVASANISTIHSFCSRLIKTYFYCLDLEGAFDIISDDDWYANALKNKALDLLFEQKYEAKDETFLYVLAILRRKRSDKNLRLLLCDAYKKVRSIENYQKLLLDCQNAYNEQGFLNVVGEMTAIAQNKIQKLLLALDNFEKTFQSVENEAKYAECFASIRASLNYALTVDIFNAPKKLAIVTKPRDSQEEKAIGESYQDFKTRLAKAYEGIYKDVDDRQTEYRNYVESGKLSIAFSNLLIEFDSLYSALKREEGKLDYNDLEQLTYELLQNSTVRSEVREKFKHVYVDEYQDVNPVQESIISAIGGENVFLVGDVKQAIYGFRGSKSLFFAQKYKTIQGGDGIALKLSNNFRSADGILDFVNQLFSRIMTEASCGIDYDKTSKMIRGGGYPQGIGQSIVHIYGEDEGHDSQFEDVYSLIDNSRALPPPSRQGKAIAEIVRRQLGSQYYDVESKTYRRITEGDICILSRKKSGENITGIVRALLDAGYAVAGASDDNICSTPEVKSMIDILSYIDNSQQDIPMVTTLLSPIGNFSEDELAYIRVAFKEYRNMPFRECVSQYARLFTDDLAKRITAFFNRVKTLKDLSELYGAGTMIDVVLEKSGLEAIYSKGDGLKLKNVRKLAEQAYSANGQLTIAEFLEKVSDGGYYIPAPEGANSNSIKIMTMHASKGLEFPVVIITDVCKSFKGQPEGEMPFDDKYGFTPKCYNVEERTRKSTLLSRLQTLRAESEDIKNEMNLYYVACTRAMFSLHIMASRADDYDPTFVGTITSYSQMTDISKLPHEYMEDIDALESVTADKVLISNADERTLDNILAVFNRQYDYQSSITLPVKSSASKILKLSYQFDDNPIEVKELYKDDEISFNAADEGTAYHRYLELCDFSIVDREGIARQLDNMLKLDKISQEQYDILDCDKLKRILSMPIFKSAIDRVTYREREFICKLPANQFLDTNSEDGILVQGAIDLLILGADGMRVVDYKHSKKSSEKLKEDYLPQLQLYAKVVATIFKIDVNTIKLTIVNINKCEEISLN